MKNKAILADFWFNNFLVWVPDPSLPSGKLSLCGLCGNDGIVDTTSTATSPKEGVPSPGGKFYCVCPNGRARKGNNTSNRVEP